MTLEHYPEGAIERKLEAASAMLVALRDAQRVMLKHGFGGTDQNPFGIHDIVGSAILKAERAGL